MWHPLGSFSNRCKSELERSHQAAQSADASLHPCTTPQKIFATPLTPSQHYSGKDFFLHSSFIGILIWSKKSINSSLNSTLIWALKKKLFNLGIAWAIYPFVYLLSHIEPPGKPSNFSFYYPAVCFKSNSGWEYSKHLCLYNLILE